MPEYANILYWKWGYDVFEGSRLEEGLMDIIERSDFELLYVSFHHVSYPFSDPRIQDAVRKCDTLLRSHGRKLLLDIDIRNEGESFEKAFPGHKAFYSRFVEMDLDEQGNGSIELENLTVGKVGRQPVKDPPEYIINSWAFTLADPSHFVPGSLVNVKAVTSIESIDDHHARIAVSAGPGHAGKRVLVYPAIRHAIPDPFSPHLYEFFSSMFEQVRDIPLGGAATDEWGFELALKHEGDDYFTEHFPFSPHMCRAYERRTGRQMEEDMLHFLYAPAGGDGLRMAAVSAYLEVLRAQMRENNDWFYAKTKDVFGPDAFVGVHPTFWGDATDFYLDVVLNGLDWWEVRRDYAQTDEWVLLPIRLALAHKWGGAVWYNMWYSGNTNIKETYFEDTWVNARYGGRTHYLGYECPNEPGVLPLKQPGLLEEMDRMEGEIKKINAFQISQPDSRVLVIFGMEAVSCWNICAPEARTWHRNGGTLRNVLKYTKSLFDKYLCDLIPSSEIVNGSLEIADGKARYGSQTYDAVVFLLPEGIHRKAFDFLKAYYKANSNLILIGECRYFSDGEQAADVFDRFASGMEHHLINIESIDETVAILKRWDIDGNVYQNGCVYQDGSVIFTTSGEKNTGNPLDVDVVIKGHRVRFTGEDFLAINIGEDGSVRRVAAGQCDLLEIDGKAVRL